MEQVIFILYGIGSNGKTTLVEAIRRMLGGYARTADSTLLLASKNEGVRNDVARLAGARFVATAETEGGRHLAEALVKQLSGGDTLTARFLYGEFFEFHAQFKLFLSTNHKPKIHGTDKGIWRRIRLVPFNVTVPDSEQDKQLPEKLRTELPGILTWAVQGCLEWLREGLGVPQEVIDATESYRQEMDHVGAFIADRCVQDITMKISVGELYGAYINWCEENGEQALKKRDFGLQLSERGFAASRIGKARFRHGLRLVTQVTQHDADSTKPAHEAAQQGICRKPTSHSSPTSLASAEMPVVEVDI
jgi:putative DNA primase/helicase